MGDKSRYSMEYMHVIDTWPAVNIWLFACDDYDGA
jgi:hypothetical protein